MALEGGERKNSVSISDSVYLTFNIFFPLSQIVLNEFLEQEHTEDDVGAGAKVPKDDDAVQDVPDLTKGKSGNGMKSKNSKKTEESKPKKRPLLDLNLEEHERLARDDEEDLPVTKRNKKVFDESHQDGGIDEAPKLSKGKGKSSGRGKGSSGKKEEKGKIELTEDLLHGPFDFSAHRQDHQRNGKFSPGTTSSTGTIKGEGKKSLDGLREDLRAVVASMDGGGKRESANRSPEVVELLADEPRPAQRTPPIVVDLSKADRNEKRELLSGFLNMFPGTPREYLEEQAEELAGKPAATERFITEHLKRECQPPEYWIPGMRAVVGLLGSPPRVTEAAKQESAGAEEQSVIIDGETEILPDPGATVPQELPGSNQAAGPQRQDEEVGARLANVVEAPPGREELVDLASIPAPQETEEDKIESKFATLQALFPKADPHFLHQRVVELIADDAAFTRWVDESLESKGRDFPSREEYERRQKEAEMMEKYSQEVTAEEILDMYDDPVTYFSDKARKVSDLYKRHAMGQLKKVFRNLSAVAINKAFNDAKGLYYPSYKALKLLEGSKKGSHSRKTKRPDHECSVPGEIDINFLKVTNSTTQLAVD